MVIYLMTNKINNKKYVGQTITELRKRMLEHCRKHTLIVDRAIHKYGIENFDIEVIDTAKSLEELNQKEIYWIKYYDCLIPKGYNQCYGGGNTTGYHHKKETRKKMSKLKEGMYFGEENPFYHKKHTEETKQHLKEKWHENEEMYTKRIEHLKSVRKIHYKKVRCIEDGKVYNSVKECANFYGLKDTHISRVCKGKRKHTGGLSFEYVN